MDVIRGRSIDPTDCDERTEGDVGRSSIVYMSDVNVVPKRTETMLSEGINKYFLFLLYSSLWRQIWNLIVIPCIGRVSNCSHIASNDRTINERLKKCGRKRSWLNFR
jgi:hypothetical protein